MSVNAITLRLKLDCASACLDSRWTAEYVQRQVSLHFPSVSCCMCLLAGELFHGALRLAKIHIHLRKSSLKAIRLIFACDNSYRNRTATAWFGPKTGLPFSS